MHVITLVIHEDDINLPDWLYRFSSEAEEYYERWEEVSVEDGWKYSGHQDSTNELLTSDKIRFLLDEYYYDGYDEEKGVLYRRGNPNNFGDWWAIGGRWSGMLIDNKGIHYDSLLLDELDVTHPDGIENIYAINRQYLGEDWYDEELGENSKEAIEKEIQKALKYEKETNIPLRVTLVDWHQ